MKKILLFFFCFFVCISTYAATHRFPMDNQWHSLQYHDTALMVVPKKFPQKRYGYDPSTASFVCYVASDYVPSDPSFFIRSAVNAQGWKPGKMASITVKVHNWYSHLNVIDELQADDGLLSSLGIIASVKIVNEGCAKGWRFGPGDCTDTNYNEQGIKIRCYTIPPNYKK